MSSILEFKLTQVYSIGYRTQIDVLSINTFFECLAFYDVKSLIDIRADAMPQDFPEYDREHLFRHCKKNNITYHWAGQQLGNTKQGSKHSLHNALDDATLRAYADYMATYQFQIAATQVINMAKQGSVAIFSKSVVPTIDFRFLLADYLVLQGIQVSHITSIDETFDHLLHKNARRESIELIYDHVV